MGFGSFLSKIAPIAAFIPGVGTVAAAGLTVAGGLMESGEAQRAGQKAERSSEAARQKQEAFTEKEMARWEEVYGDIQANLGDFYEKMDASYYTTTALTSLEQEYSKVHKRMTEELAQEGMLDSGRKYATIRDLSFAKAEAAAQIRAEAPFKVAEQQRKFVTSGANIYSAAVGGVTKATTSRIASEEQKSSDLYSSAGRLAQQAGELLGELPSMFEDIRKPEPTTTPPITV